MDVSRWAIYLNLIAPDRARLERLIRDGNTRQKLVPRARVALLSDDTRMNGTIAKEAGTSLPTVHRWRRRFQAQSVEGLLRDKTPPSRHAAAAAGFR